MNLKDFSNLKKIHFIGIGGIGMSAVARMFLEQGKKVSGSDISKSNITEELEKCGAKIYIGHKGENISKETDLVIYTIAAPVSNPELVKAKNFNIPTLTYPQVLGVISREKFTIAISGSHGKTTTTAMTAKILIDAGFSPTVVAGSLLKDFKSNFIAGKGKYFLVEACEYRRSFLNLSPDILVITNIDNDHLDYYKDISDIQSAFRELALKVPKKGYIICNLYDPTVAPVLEKLDCEILDFSSVSAPVEVPFPSDYNINNAKAAFRVAEILRVDKEKILNSLKSFSGTWRRTEFRGKTEKGALVYDDYAHHPTEIKAALRGLRDKYKDKKITVVFQPHLFSRTKLLLDDFSESFGDADEIILVPIYAARERPDESINSDILRRKIQKKGKRAKFFSDFDEVVKYLKSETKEKDLIVTMGAGDVYKVADLMVTV